MEEATPQSGGPTPETLHKRKIAMLGLGSLFLIIAIIWAVYWFIWGQFEIDTDDAYVNGNLVQVMAQVPGTVIAINTDDTHLVRAGQVLVQLDATDTSVALQNAEASLAQTVRQLQQYYEAASRAQATLTLRKADLTKAQLDVKRRANLVGTSAVSREEFQHYQTAMQAAQAQYDVALHNLRSAEAFVTNTQLYTHPWVERAKANYKTAYLNRVRTSIVAPINGFVAKRNVQIGQQVTLNSAMMAIVPLKEIWVDANFKESQLNNLRIGQPATITADAYPDVTFHGKVYGVGAGTGSAFSLLPPQNATGNWIKIVQRLPVRIALDPDELMKHPLQLGISMQVTVDTHDLTGHRLAENAETKSVYTTHVYDKQLADATKAIDAILKANAPNTTMTKSALHG